MLADDFRVQIDSIPNGRFEWMLWQLDDENFAYLLRDRGKTDTHAEALDQAKLAKQHFQIGSSYTKI